MDKNERPVGGKAEGLARLSAIAGIRVPSFIAVPADADLEEQQQIVADFIRNNGGLGMVAVRSSALGEDGELASFAGAFKTHLNVPLTHDDVLAKIADIRNHGEDKLTNIFNKASGVDNTPSVGVVIQQMVEEPDFAGVCLSQAYAEEDNAYMLVNFKTGLGEGLVGGEVDGRQFRVLRGAAFKDKTYPFLSELTDAMQRIEAAHGGRPMDIEFAVKDGTLFILQARPFVTDTPTQKAKQDMTLEAAQAVNAEVAELPADDLFCDMSDINPRELLGGTAKKINISIFRTMFADSIVEKARAEMGYAPLHAGLLREIGDKPYISIRNSAYSFRPQGVSEATYDKMVDIYRAQLLESPQLQDSVEFNVFRTNALQLPAFFAAHPEAFTADEQKELVDAFTQLDTSFADSMARFCRAGYGALEAYEEKIAALTSASRLGDILAVLQEGTEMFVKAARFAFYKKAAFDGAYGADETAKALSALDTPSEKLQLDLLSFARGDIGREALAAEYGHLRAGQMDMFMPPYRDDLAKNLNLDTYTSLDAGAIAAREQDIKSRHAAFETYYKTLDAAQKADAETLRFVFSAREYVKHGFMKAYDLLAERILDATDAAQLNANQVPKLVLSDVAALEKIPALGAMIEVDEDKPFLVMPAVLSAETDLCCVDIAARRGTYFSRALVEAAPLVVTDDNLQSLTAADVKGKILVMDHADPGYDFLLLYEPAGIITRVGGPASHIAIRVNERGLPACIGSGLDPASVDETRTYVLDCVNGKHYAGATDVSVAPKKGKGGPDAPRPS